MSGATVTVYEWETLRPDRGSPLAERKLSNDKERALAERLTGSRRIEILELARGIEIRATSFVGRLALGEVTVTIRPKLPDAPFLNLLRYAYGLRNLDLYDPIGYGSTKWSFQDLLILQLAAEVAELLVRGIHREYERVQEDLANPRGRIEFDRFVWMRYQSTPVLPCVHYPRTENTLLNQVVLAGLLNAARITASVDLRAHLTRLIKTLSPIVSLRGLNTTILHEARTTIDRRTTAYESTLVLIGLLLKTEGISFDERIDRVLLPGFLFDMNRFFQALISRFLHDYLEGCDVQDEYRLNDLFRYDPERNPLKRNAPVPKPDFVIRRDGKTEAILDAKYRDLWGKPLPQEMLYQLALYALSQSGNRRKAVILYPTLSTDASDQTICLCEPATGATQAHIILRPVKLTELEMLLRSKGSGSNKRKATLAKELALAV